MLDLTSLADMTIETVLNRWPQTAVVFRRRQMMCVGCEVSSFCVVTDAAEIHDLPVNQLLAELEQAIIEDVTSSAA